MALYPTHMSADDLPETDDDGMAGDLPPGRDDDEEENKDEEGLEEFLEEEESED